VCVKLLTSVRVCVCVYNAQESNEEQTSTAFGYGSHLVMLMAKYFDVCMLSLLLLHIN